MKRATDPDTMLLQGAADASRLAILRQLAEAASAVCACDLTGCCGVAQPTVSHHLKVLRETGWVTSERRGSWVHYLLRADAVERFAAIAAEFRGLGAGVPPRDPDGLRVPLGDGDGLRVLPVLQPRG